MLELPLGKLDLADGVVFSFPLSVCCNCGSRDGVTVVKQDTRQTTYLGLGGTEITFHLPLPFCSTCASTANRRPKTLFHRLLMFALLFGVSFLGLIVLGDVVLAMPQLSEYVFHGAVVLAAAIMAAILLLGRPKGRQTSHYQPVRITKLKREFLSGKVVGIRFAFTNKEYARLFSAQNQEPIRSQLVDVES